MNASWIVRSVAVFALCLVVADNAWAQSLAWARQAGGLDIDSPNAVAADAAGNSYVTGIFSKSRACFICGNPATFGAGQPNETILTSVDGTQDIFVAKYDNTGTLLWARAAGSGGPDEAWGIAVDGSGNSYITGIIGPADFGNGVTLTGAGGFVAKYNSNGQAIWATTLDPAGAAFAIALDASGNATITGLAPDPVLGGEIVTVWKVGTNGSQLWMRQARGVYGGVGTAVSVDGAGNSYVVGRITAGSATFGGGEPNETTLTDFIGAANELFVAKYDPSGNLMWAKQSADIPGLLAYGTGVSTDGAGNSFVVGFGTTILGLGEANETAIPGDNFVAKYDSAGNLVWAKSISGRPVEAKGVVTGSTGGAYITGGFATAVTFAPGEENQTTLLSLGGFFGGDMFVACYDAEGRFEWARQAGPGTGSLAISIDSLTNAYVVGIFAGDSTFGSGEPNETVLTSTGTEWDLFVAKYLNDAGTGNQPPVADDQDLVTAEDTPIDITLTATDADGNTLVYEIVTGPVHGDLSGDPPNVTYTPHLNYHGQDSFTFRAFDGTDYSPDATVSITVTPVNDAPVAHSQVLTTPANTPLAITLTADDVDGNQLTFTIVRGPLHGLLLLGMLPNLTYVPEPGYSGPDSFTFTVFDGTALSNEATVAITVAPSSLVCGALTSGSISAPGEVDQYTFVGQAGQIISVALASTGGFAGNAGSRSVSLTLFDPSGAAVGTLRSNRQANFTLPVAGTYVMRVSAANRVMTGSYNLNVECLVPPSADAVPVTCGRLASGRIGAAAQVDLYTFVSQQAGQIISIALASTGGFAGNAGSRSVGLTLFDPSGAVVGTLRSNRQANFTLPVAGTYVMRVSATNLALTGSYNLNVECLVPPSADAVPVTCGTLASGTIGAAAQVDLHTLVGQQAGQIISVALASTGGFAGNAGSRSVELTLFDPSGAAVGTLRSNRQANFTLPVAGTYVMRVSATNLAVTGSYNLNVECLVPPSADAVPVTCGTLASGTIGAAAQVNLYAFDNQQAGQIIAFALTSTAGFAGNAGSRSVELTLFDPSGVAVGTLRSNRQANFTLPVAGTYVIRVSAANLSMTGSYTVTLGCS